MARKRMNPKDIDQLLTHYRGERGRLRFQLDKVLMAIAELKTLREANVGTDDGAEVVKRGPGRPKGSVNKTKRAGRKPGRRKKRTIKGRGYRLSPWDEMMLGQLTRADRLLPKSDLLAGAKAWAKKNEPRMKVADVEVKVTRVLQKLSGKRGEMGTYRSGLRRGYHYGLKPWFFASTGKLRPQHLAKLVTSEKKAGNK